MVTAEGRIFDGDIMFSTENQTIISLYEFSFVCKGSIRKPLPRELPLLGGPMIFQCQDRCNNVLICIEMLLYVNIAYVGWLYIKPGGRGLLYMCPVVGGLLLVPCDDSIYIFPLFQSV